MHEGASEDLDDVARNPSGGVDVSATLVERFGHQLLTAAGMEANEAQTVSSLLVETSLRGTDSHGVVRYPVYARRTRHGGITSPAPTKWLRDEGGSCLLDAGGGAGHVVGVMAVDRAIERSAEHGVAAIGVRNSNHLGALASYADRMAEAGRIGIVMTNASPRMAPTGGAERLLGNNPWAIGVPHPEGPLVMDIANSVVAGGKLRLVKAKGETLPPGWAMDADGRPTTDPDAGLAGILEPIGGHKGYAILFMFDVMCGIMTGAANGPDVSDLFTYDRPMNCGHLFLALDVAAFTSEAEFSRRIAELGERLRGARRAPGVDEIFLPGDLEKRAIAKRTDAGLPLSAAVLADYLACARELQVAVPAWLDRALELTGGDR